MRKNSNWHGRVEGHKYSTCVISGRGPSTCIACTQAAPTLALTCPQMDAQRPGDGSAPGGTPPGKSALNNRQEVVDVLGQDLYPAVMTLVLLLLGLMSAALTRCECL